jgi:hypothetical protein
MKLGKKKVYLDGIGQEMPLASDHCPVVVEFESLTTSHNKPMERSLL